MRRVRRWRGRGGDKEIKEMERDREVRREMQRMRRYLLTARALLVTSSSPLPLLFSFVLISSLAVIVVVVAGTL